MAEFTLAAASPLGGHSHDFDGTRLAEVTDLGLVSVAVPLGGDEALAEAARAAWGIELPGPGALTRGADGVRLMWLAPDQMMLVAPRGEGLAVDEAAARLGDAAYVTEQSDGWVVLTLEGPAAWAALERICPVDLHPAAFPEDRVARTVMEHLGAIVLREGPERFLLMSASSSARSFLHAVETSLRNVV